MIERKILVFDNYDSFTYNLVHLIEHITQQKIDVYRNDEIALDKVNDYDKIVLSPGPGVPNEAGLLKPLIEQYGATKSILGVCLGHQAIGEVFGGELTNLKEVYHGLAMPIQVVDKSEIPENNQVKKSILHNVPNNSLVGRYHSWVVNKANFPKNLTITALDENGYVMALQHNEFDIQGVQFHPESILTPFGKQMMENWLSY